MDKKSFIIGGVLGIIAGAAGMYFTMRYKMVDDMAEVTESMRKYYKEKYGGVPNPEVTAQNETNEAEKLEVKVKEAAPIQNDAHAVDYTKYRRPIPFNVESVPAEDGESAEYIADMGEEENLEPYSVSPDDFNEDNGYKKILLTWYEKNRVLAYDSNPHITLDPDEWMNLVGDFENHFDDWERDSVYMRNDVDRVDYAIDACITNYTELIKVVPDDRAFNKEDDDD